MAGNRQKHNTKKTAMPIGYRLSRVSWALAQIRGRA